MLSTRCTNSTMSLYQNYYYLYKYFIETSSLVCDLELAHTLCTFLRFPIWCTRSTDEAPWFPNLLLGIPQLIIFSHLEASKQIDTTPYIYICPLRLLFELAHILCPFWIYRYVTFETLKAGVPFSIFLVVVIEKRRFFLSQKTLFSKLRCFSMAKQSSYCALPLHLDSKLLWMWHRKFHE